MVNNVVNKLSPDKFTIIGHNLAAGTIVVYDDKLWMKTFELAFVCLGSGEISREAVPENEFKMSQIFKNCTITVSEWEL